MTVVRLAWWIFACLVLAMILHPLFARAQGVRPLPMLDTKRCIELSQWVEHMAEIRDVEAHQEKHLALLRRRNLDQPPAMIALLVREVGRVYAAPAKKPEVLAGEFLERCMLGLLGRES